MNEILQKDVHEFASTFQLSNELDEKSFLITGATGLIGSSLIHCLLALKKRINVIAPVRNIQKAREIFDTDELAFIKLIECDITTFNYSSLDATDYIIHCAAPTSSKYFIEHPVDTFAIIYEGTKALLDFASKKKVKSFVYLSSLEVYGEINDDSTLITENVQGYLDPTSVRSSYPMAKRAVENLCCLYAAQYGVQAKIARLTQTTGAGIAKDDNRIIAQFARLAVNGQDIILHTTGESARPYCYTIDCVSAILYILLKGFAGEAYNVANENTYISARGMAEFLRDNFNQNIQVKIELKENMGYAPVTKQRLSTQKLTNLGWSPRFNLNTIFNRLIQYLR